MDRHYLKKSYDVVVIGGGMSGCCAAIAAARHGASVGFIQDRPVLGGNASSEIRVGLSGACWIASTGKPYHRHARETGIIDEIRTEYWVRDPHWSHSLRDLILLEHVDAEKRIDLYLNYRACDVVMKRPGTIGAVRAEPLVTETPIELEAGVFIDASGDGWVAALAGAEWRTGREGRDEFDENLAPEKPDTYTMGNSIYFTTKDVGKPVKFVAPDWAIAFNDEKFPLRDHDGPTEKFWWLEYGGMMNTIEDADAIYRELTRIVMGVWDHIKNSGHHDADNLALDWIGKVPGRRESRRFMGDHVLRQSDLIDSVRFDDRVAYGGWWIDQHPPGGVYDPAPPAAYPPTEDIYSIPMRSLYSRNIDNLLLAGRSISTTHVAHASTRVMLTLSVIGQASGTAAALCAEHRCLPRAVAADHIAELQQRLLRDDAYLIGLPNQDPRDLARAGKATATSTWTPSDGEAEEFGHSDFGAANVLSGIARPEKGVSSNLWVSDPGAGLPQELTVELPERAEIGQIDLRFDTNLNVRHVLGPAPECVRDYRIELRSEGHWHQVHTETGNCRRHRIHDIGPLRGDAVRLTVLATHGAFSARVYEVRIYPPTA